ncbi:MAG: glycerophosphodiester phosphodiesterase family protein [Motiliproteus sp.]
MSPFELIGHRGYPDCYPENTLLGFIQAVAAGACYLEADVQLSADGIPYVFHDRDLNRLCGVDGRINCLSSTELDRLYAWAPEQFGSRFSDQPLLRLDRLLQWLETEPQVTLFLELKRSMTQVLSPQQAVARVIEEIDRCSSVRRQLVLISFSIKLLQMAREQGWDRLAPVLTRWYQLRHLSVRRLQPDWLFINHRRIPDNALFPEDLPPVVIYKITGLDAVYRWAERGFCWIETDDIGGMLTARQSRQPLVEALTTARSI